MKISKQKKTLNKINKITCYNGRRKGKAAC